MRGTGVKIIEFTLLQTRFGHC